MSLFLDAEIERGNAQFFLVFFFSFFVYLVWFCLVWLAVFLFCFSFRVGWFVCFCRRGSST